MVGAEVRWRPGVTGTSERLYRGGDREPRRRPRRGLWLVWEWQPAGQHPGAVLGSDWWWELRWGGDRKCQELVRGCMGAETGNQGGDRGEDCECCRKW